MILVIIKLITSVDKVMVLFITFCLLNETVFYLRHQEAQLLLFLSYVDIQIEQTHLCIILYHLRYLVVLCSVTRTRQLYSNCYVLCIITLTENVQKRSGKTFYISSGGIQLSYCLWFSNSVSVLTLYRTLGSFYWHNLLGCNKDVSNRIIIISTVLNLE